MLGQLGAGSEGEVDRVAAARTGIERAAELSGRRAPSDHVDEDLLRTETHGTCCVAQSTMTRLREHVEIMQW